jgi:archaetidylinositol phosphate synthase
MYDTMPGQRPMNKPYGVEVSAQVENGRSGFVNAVRVHNALTARLEKRLLTWMAARIPEAISPDHLTALALASQILAGAAYALSSRDGRFLWLVNGFLFLNWLGDSLDGTLARVRNQLRPRYGFYVDHMADAFGALALMAGLACSGYLHWEIAAGMLVCFYALSIESYLATYTTGRFHLSHGIFGPTELRILLALGNILVRTHPYVSFAGRHLRSFDVGGAVAIAGMSVMVLSAAIRQTIVLYEEEALL